MEIDTRALFNSTSVSLLMAVALGCGWESQRREAAKSTESVTVMKLTSSEFENGARLDAKFTVEGQDISPPLAWSEMPSGTQSFAVICDDPDAPHPQRPAAEPWVHWVIFNIPADRSELSQGISRSLQSKELPVARQGENSWPSDNVGYRGPAPPPGSGPHRYFFRIYALDTMLELSAGATKQQLLEAMSGRVLAEGQLVGIYER